MKRSILAVMFAAAALTGCAPDKGDDGYSDEELARYKSALPVRAALQLRTPPSSMAATLGAEPALYPGFAVPLAMQINGLVGGTLDIIEYVAAQEPTLYDSEDLEFWWGPIPDAESAIEGDHFSLFIHDRIDDADFNPGNGDLRYEFAIIRGIGNDVSTLTPILYGQATPVEDTDYGLGAFVYDFDNNVEFEDAHNPGHGPLTSGRMATIFAKGPDENNPAADVTFVIAAFREFLPEDAGVGATAANVDYFWGNFVEGAFTFDFLDVEFAADVIDDTTAVEDMGMKLAFFNSGIGRAEIGVTGGDVGAAPNEVSAIECWDAAVTQTYLSFSLDTGGGPVLQGEAGVPGDCVWTAEEFANVPDLAAAPDMLALVDLIADSGIPSDLEEAND